MGANLQTKAPAEQLLSQELAAYLGQAKHEHVDAKSGGPEIAAGIGSAIQ